MKIKVGEKDYRINFLLKGGLHKAIYHKIGWTEGTKSQVMSE